MRHRTRYLDPDELGVRYPKGDGPAESAMARHRQALRAPGVNERDVLALAEALDRLAARATADTDWLWCADVVAPALDAFRASLNWDLGRLDAATLETFRVRICRHVGLDPDTHMVV